MIDRSQSGGIVLRTIEDALRLRGDARFQRLMSDSQLNAKMAMFKKPFGTWFRGQNNHESDLEPSIFRTGRYYDETSMVYRFELRAAASSSRCRSSFDWLCLMRHFELPTRLLDWSENLLVALFFASKPPNNIDGRLFAINTRKLNRASRCYPHESSSIVPHRSKDVGPAVPWSLEVAIRADMARARTKEDLVDLVDSLDRNYVEDATSLRVARERFTRNPDEILRGLLTPIAVLPNWLDSRMTLQQSMFTIHGGKVYDKNQRDLKDETLLPSPVGFNELSKNLPEGEEFLFSVRLDARCKETIREQLLYVGVHEGSLFPELDRQAAYLREQSLFET